MAALRRIGCLLLHEPAAAFTPAARRALLEVALAHSPRVEDAGPGLVHLDLTGLRGLFGDEPAIGRRLREAAAGRGFSVKVGVGGSRASAGLAAHLAEDVSVIAPGEEAAALAPAPLSLLGASPETLAVLERWGLSTLGELAALPPVSLFERLGAEGLRLRELALGRDPHPLSTWEPPRVFEESTALDWEVAELDPLGEIVSALAERICARLEAERLDADRIEWTLSLADRALHEGLLSPAVPTREPAALAALVRSALESRPPAAGVIAITLRAYPVRVPSGQGSLMDPPRPSEGRSGGPCSR
jgi:protein ImuB